MATLRFALHDENKRGSRPINLIYSVQGQRKFFRTRIKLYEANWDCENQVAVYMDRKSTKNFFIAKREKRPATRIIDYHLLLSSTEADDVNDALNSYRKEIRDIERRFEMDGIEYSSKMVMDKLKENKKPLTKKEAKPELLKAKSAVILDYISNWITNHSTTRAKGSLSVYRSLYNCLAALVEEKRIDITFDKMDHSFMEMFQNFLIERRGMSNVTVAKRLSVLKGFLAQARKDGYKVADNFKDFRMKNPEKGVLALEWSEFEAVVNLDLSDNEKYDRVRDFFIFGCVTGLRYSDLASLRRENIFKDEIRITVQKTKEILTIPLNKYSSAILSKYKHLPTPIPVLANQLTNKYLTGYEKKERSGNVVKHIGIGQLAGLITPVEEVHFFGNRRQVTVYKKFEKLTCHIARKSFISLSLANGVQSHIVMQTSGHKSFSSFRKYIHIANNNKKKAMTDSWGAIPATDLIAV